MPLEDDSAAGLAQLGESADMDTFHEMLAGGEAHVKTGHSIEPVLYSQCFASPAGQMVLEDMYRRYVNVTIAVPGEGVDAGENGAHVLKHGAMVLRFRAIVPRQIVIEGDFNSLGFILSGQLRNPDRFLFNLSIGNIQGHLRGPYIYIMYIYT